MLGVDVVCYTLGAEAGAAADVNGLEVAGGALELGLSEGSIAHLLGPVEGVDDGVVHDGEEAVKPEGFAFVLDEPAATALGALAALGGGGHRQGAAGGATGWAERRIAGGETRGEGRSSFIGFEVCCSQWGDEGVARHCDGQCGKVLGGDNGSESGMEGMKKLRERGVRQQRGRERSRWVNGISIR